MSALIRYAWALEFYCPRERSRMRYLYATRDAARAEAQWRRANQGASAIVRRLERPVLMPAEAPSTQRIGDPAVLP